MGTSSIKKKSTMTFFYLLWSGMQMCILTFLALLDIHLQLEYVNYEFSSHMKFIRVEFIAASVHYNSPKDVV